MGIHLIFYFHTCMFTILTHFDTLNVGFVGTLSYIASVLLAPLSKSFFLVRKKYTRTYGQAISKVETQCKQKKQKEKKQTDRQRQTDRDRQKETDRQRQTDRDR